MQQVYNRLPHGGPPCLGDIINLLPKYFPCVGKEQDMTVGRGYKEVFYKIFLSGCDPCYSFSSPTLTPIETYGISFNVTIMGDGYLQSPFSSHPHTFLSLR